MTSKPGEEAADPAGEGGPPPPEPEDLAGALRFIHLLQAQSQARVAELSATVSALIETLIGGGQVPLEAYERRKRLTVIRENERTANEPGIEISDAPDKYAMADLPRIDCAARIHLCRARCCAMPFALSVQDLDERIVRWDYARPYRIARRPDGACVHNEGGSCSIYERRPATCRAYDCRTDRRVWIDFDRGIPAP